MPDNENMSLLCATCISNNVCSFRDHLAVLQHFYNGGLLKLAQETNGLNFSFIQTPEIKLGCKYYIKKGD